MRVRRIDLGNLQKPVKRADGSMIVQARFTRSGVFEYRKPDGSIQREYRAPEQVFSKESMDSFKLVPFTNDHPPEMLNPTNAKQYTAGFTGQDVHRDGIWMVGSIAITDAGAVNDLEAGKNQISNGYDCDLVMTPGVSPEGEHYDCMQTNIGGNHVALVWNARAGSDAAVRMDAAICDSNEQQGNKENVMNLEQALAALAAAQKENGALTVRCDTAEKALEAVKKEADKQTARADSLDEELKKEKKAHTDAVSAAPAKVRARMALEQKAAQLLGDKAKSLKLDAADTTDDAIKLAVIKEVTGTDCAGKSPAYIEARYDAAIEQADKSGEVFKAANDVIVKNHTDGANADGDHWAKMRDEAAKKQHTFIAPGTK